MCDAALPSQSVGLPSLLIGLDPEEIEDLFCDVVIIDHRHATRKVVRAFRDGVECVIQRFEVSDVRLCSSHARKFGSDHVWLRHCLGDQIPDERVKGMGCKGWLAFT
jgi:hypothetical protein